jgi:nucleoside 2-deoxyribosyltransferase
MIEVYLAGRMTGKTVEEAMKWRREIVQHFGEDHYVHIHNPCYMLEEAMKKGEILDEKGPEGHHYFNGAASYQRDIWMLDRCDVVVANLKKDDWQSLGTVFELGYAKAMNKLIIVIAEPEDFASRHIFIRSACTVVGSVAEAIIHLENLSFGPRTTEGH